MKISQTHLNGWNTFNDVKLQRQYLYIMKWAYFKEDLVYTMEKLMNERNLKTFSNEILIAEFEKAMKEPYHLEGELLDRVQKALYGEN